MAWKNAGTNRWKADDSLGRHLLQRTGDRFVELHGSAVHVYDMAGNEDPADPLATATWHSTHTREDLVDIDDASAWVYLASPVYTRRETP